MGEAGGTDDALALLCASKRRKLGSYYVLGAIVLVVATLVGSYASSVWLVLLWPALSLAIVALAYFRSGTAAFQKKADGTVSLASRVLLWPYRLGARLNVWAWTRKLPPVVEIADGVHLGRFPSRAEAGRFSTVIDLTAEFEKPGGASAMWMSMPMLDLVMPTEADLSAAAHLVEARRVNGAVLVCCALGFQRSAGVVLRWLVVSGRAANRDEALAILRRTGRPVHLGAEHPVTSEP